MRRPCDKAVPFWMKQESNSEWFTFLTVLREIDSLSLRDVGREHILISNPTKDEFDISVENFLTIFKIVSEKKQFASFLTPEKKGKWHTS